MACLLHPDAIPPYRIAQRTPESLGSEMSLIRYSGWACDLPGLYDNRVDYLWDTRLVNQTPNVKIKVYIYAFKDAVPESPLVRKL